MCLAKLRGQVELRQPDPAPVEIHPPGQSIGEGAHLLVDLLLHEVPVFALFGGHGVPGQPVHLRLDPGALQRFDAHVSIETLEEKRVEPQVHRVSWDPVAAEKGTYRSFMQKEIHEQVRSLTDTLAGHVDFAGGGGETPT